MILADKPIGVSLINERYSKVVWYHLLSSLFVLLRFWVARSLRTDKNGFHLSVSVLPISFFASTEAYETDCCIACVVTI